MELLARFGSGGCPHDWTALEPWALWTWKARKGAARSGGGSIVGGNSSRRRLGSGIDNNPRATLETHYTFKGKIHALRQCIKEPQILEVQITDAPQTVTQSTQLST